VGVAGDGKYLMLGEAPRSYFYVPLAQNYRSPITLMVRSSYHERQGWPQQPAHLSSRPKRSGAEGSGAPQSAYS